MNATVNKMVSAYGQAQVDSGVASASPHKLISMLYEGALVAIANANLHLARGDIPARGVAISKAIAIIDEGLKISIDMEAGGELAQNLRSLYEYMSYRLLTANIHSDRAALEEVEGLLRELKNAWDMIDASAPAKAATPANEPPRVAASYGKA
jgi:flagellar protein FliS